MKKILLLAISLFLLVSKPVFGLIVTNNVHRDKFQYEVTYTFATDDLAASITEGKVAVIGGGAFRDNFAFVIPRDGRLVGISVAGSSAVTAGGATFDVTINDTVTGVQAVIAPGTRSAVGNAGSAGAQYSYMRQDRTEQVVHKGFNQSSGSPSWHDRTHPYGKATAITAGNRIGVKVSTDSAFATTQVNTSVADYVIVIYVLE